MRILVTGGAGFCGSHICDRYVTEGNTVTVLDNLFTGSMDNIKQHIGKSNFKFINADIRDQAAVDAAVKDADYVFHLAAQIHVDRSIVDPRVTYDINVMGTLNVLEAARKYNTKRVLFASTSEVYGTTKISPMNEDHPLDAPHPYGASKIAADRMCSAYIKTYGMDIVITRCFNFYGPRQKDSGYGAVISLFANRVLNNLPPKIYGDGNQTRDFTYIKDVVEAYDFALKQKEKFDTPLNFGSGREITINDLANEIIRLYGKEKELTPIHVEGRPGEVLRLVADSSKARTMGWIPKYTIEEGLKEFTQWYKENRKPSTD